MRLREKNLERRRQRILAATRELIAREGADGWSMRKVAQAAEVSVPTLYNLFGSKDEIRSAMCAGAFDELDRGFDEETSPGEPIERVFALVTHGVDKVLAKAHRIRPALLERGGDFRKGPIVVARLRAAVEQAMDQGQLRPDLRADLLVAEGYEGFRRAAVLWAQGDLDPEAFRSKALYSTCLCLLAVATDETRRELVRTARDLEQELVQAREPNREQ